MTGPVEVLLTGMLRLGDVLLAGAVGAGGVTVALTVIATWRGANAWLDDTMTRRQAQEWLIREWEVLRQAWPRSRRWTRKQDRCSQRLPDWIH